MGTRAARPVAKRPGTDTEAVAGNGPPVPLETLEALEVRQDRKVDQGKLEQLRRVMGVSCA